MFSIVAGRPETNYILPPGLCEDGPNCPLLKQTTKNPRFGQAVVPTSFELKNPAQPPTGVGNRLALSA